MIFETVYAIIVLICESLWVRFDLWLGGQF